MSQQFLYEKLDVLKETNNLKDIPFFVESSLSLHIVLRDYQKEAFKYFFTYFENENFRKNKQVHTLFHMATGSGKTVIMAGLILYLYMKGYRNFVFFVNQTNILEKTKDNFLNALSKKYLFANDLSYAGESIKVNSVSNFSHVSQNSSDINICFITTQKLHLDLTFPSENSLTYEEFENNNIVFISDESHHVNSSTKRKKKQELEDEKSWEYSVMRAFNANKDNIMLEFTATCNIKDENVLNKYIDKMIYNYPLKEFRRSGYTKDFYNFSTNSTFWQRSLMAIIMSEYRKYLFADAGINVKPVVLFKSKTIKDSESFYNEFFERLKSLSFDDINFLYTTGIDSLKKALDFFRGKDENFIFLINSLQDSFDIENSIIINGSTDATLEKQLLVNSLEDADNNIRFLFTVDMLNEGWDVLNLFDIVRLYDSRQGGHSKISPYTIKEAQLIGRGARYCPFQFDNSQERFKRKYDYDVTNKYRILETMYFHSKNDSRYISELNQALVANGMADEKKEVIKYTLKDSFTESDIYKKGVVFSNKRIFKTRENVKEMEGSYKHKVYIYSIADSHGKTSNLFAKKLSSRDESLKKKIFKFSEIPYNILRGAMECYRELRFNVLKEKYPHLSSVREFLTSEKYLGNNSLELRYSYEYTSHDIFKGLVQAFLDISAYVLNLKPEFVGSYEFYPHKIKDVIRDKSISISHKSENGGYGCSQTYSDNENYRINLSIAKWYSYDDNFGTNEEKCFVKFFNDEIRPKLEKKNLNFFLVRNERIPELAIYSFDDGRRFEPDFLLFVDKKNISSNDENHQIYFEPKGEFLNNEDDDKWKEKFLLEMEEKSIICHNTLTANKDYKIIGLPFFNSGGKKGTETFEKFVEAVNKMIKTL